MIAILMATYNGETYIEEQIESLLGQTVQNFVVYIHDDCSTDNTFNIIERYAHQYPDKFVVSRNEHNTGGAKYNFMQMMVRYKADYVVLCDQDDVWNPNKIELTLNMMQDMENTHGTLLPILVHTDLKVVNYQLQTIDSSFMEMVNLKPTRVALNQVLAQNVVTGCTVMYNRALANLLSTIPSDFIMHDWWLMIVAATFGKIGFISDVTIQYRQHGKNMVGARDTKGCVYMAKRLFALQETRVTVICTYFQAQSFLNEYKAMLTLEQHRLIDCYHQMCKYNKFKRLFYLFKLRVWKYGAFRKIAQVILI